MKTTHAALAFAGTLAVAVMSCVMQVVAPALLVWVLERPLWLAVA